MYDTNYEFVIDTDKYAGNFERELCAYMTGFWDGETHGKFQADQFEEEFGIENPFEDYIHFAPTCDDDVPIMAPQCIEPTPDKYKVKDRYSSVGIFFCKRPTPELIEILKERAYKFAEEGTIFDRPVKMKILGFRMLKQIVVKEEI